MRRVETGRPRYGVDLDDTRDPAGGRAQRARGVVREGLLRRPGDRRAAVLPRQAEPPPARPAAQRPGRAPATPLRLGEREVGRLGIGRRVAAARADRAGARAPRGGAGRRARRRRRTASARRSSTSRSRRRKLRRRITEGRATWPRTCSSSPPSPPPRTTCWPPFGACAPRLRAGRLQLVMPASGPGRGAMEPRLDEALERWREAGLKAEGAIGDADPVNAVAEVCRAGPLRRGDRLHAAGPDVALAALRRPVPDRRADRPAGHARRGDEHGAPGAARRAAAARASACRSACST